MHVSKSVGKKESIGGKRKKLARFSHRERGNNAKERSRNNRGKRCNSIFSAFELGGNRARFQFNRERGNFSRAADWTLIKTKRQWYGDLLDLLDERMLLGEDEIELTEPVRLKSGNGDYYRWITDIEKVRPTSRGKLTILKRKVLFILGWK